MAKRPIPTTPEELRTYHNNRYKTSRMNLLLVVAFSAINLLLLTFNVDYYLLFSAAVPYYVTLYAKLLCGMLPEEYYGGEYEAMAAEGFFPESVFYAALAIAVIAIAVYLICFLLSKNGKSGWLVFALVFFIADTVGLLMLADIASSIIDLLFHAWVIYYLVLGISAKSKLKQIPEEKEEQTGFFG